MAALLPACEPDGLKDKVLGPARSADASVAPDASEPDGPSDTDKGAPCIAAVASDKLSAREAVMSNEATVRSDQGVNVSVLFGEFKRHCGDCHAGSAGHGGFSVNLGTFPSLVSQEALDRVTSSDPRTMMPPAPQGIPFNKRPDNDPVRAFAKRLQSWLAAGRPETFYPVDDDMAGVSGTSPYLLRKTVGMALTNLGNCVPSPKIVQMDASQLDALDTKFAAMKEFTDLPKTLRETDITSFDSEVLAKQGVIAFAPAYTLWADNAKKIRYVRLPRGQRIAFDPDTQSFDIPENTRFYKTFFTATKDLEGNQRHRKMETRIIVSRKSQPQPDGSDKQTALFGTYKWNEEETEATLVDTPYRDGTGFIDEVAPFVTDERIDDQVLREGPKNLQAARVAAGGMRDYAIPGFDRCMHCHMGSPQHDFVLGFTPLQLNRRPVGEGGVVEPAERDELNQLQRLIDYGVITGMVAPEDVAPLEKSQGSREPRNEHELAAQGYMLGNCAHCHNPTGFPSQKEESLKAALDFMPSKEGGIFQFPLEKYSPRTFRGVKQDIPMPYITPSLYDLRFNMLGLDTPGQEDKWVKDLVYEWPDDVESSQYKSAKAYFTQASHPEDPGKPLLAPWRSLIYRNVDAPFSYQEVGTVYPHMPMDTPGYDCRARQLLGSWMASIPVRWKSADKLYTVPVDGQYGATMKKRLLDFPSLDTFAYEDEPQPYSEVLGDDPSYFKAVIQANNRLDAFNKSERYTDCPAPTQDILDPTVAAAGVGLPEPQSTTVVDQQGKELESYGLWTPARPHYFETDLRSSKSWIIRRGDWYDVLVDGPLCRKACSDADCREKCKNDPYITDPVAKETWGWLLEELDTVRITPALRAFALKELPFGLWQQKAECSTKLDSAGVKKVADFATGARPEWMKYAPGITPDSRVYSITPGGQVFDMICSKCHGPEANGQSSLASTMADLTGGTTRVADLRNGLLGPEGQPGANMADPVLGFGRAAGMGNLTVEDWVARYVVWMGMGGTRATIPKSVVGTIGRSEIFGEKSGIELDFTSNTAGSANMLEIAKRSCRAVAPGGVPDPTPDPNGTDILFDPTTGQLVKTPRTIKAVAAKGRVQTYYGLDQFGLLTTNGHAELWEQLCLIDNPLPVRLVSFETTGDQGEIFYVSGFYRRASYPATAQVGDGAGKAVTGVQADNATPWCVVVPTNPELRPAYDAYKQRTGVSMPECPVLDPSGAIVLNLNGAEQGGDPDIDKWSMRGAMNAGVSVFLYLKALRSGELTRKPAYNHCEDLGK